MKRIILIAVALTAVLSGCNKNQFIVYENIPAIYYFQTPGIVSIDINEDIQKIALSKGGYPQGQTTASLETSTAVLIAANTRGKIQYDLMPQPCYSLEKSSVTLDKNATSATVEVRIFKDAMQTLPKGWYAIPLQLYSDSKVKTGSDTLLLVWQKL